jgi:hypothetical protein
MFRLQMRYREPNGDLFDYAGSLPTYHELKPLLDHEIRRARRYERPLSLLMLSPDRSAARSGTGSAQIEGTGPSIMQQLQFGYVGALLRDTLRETDLAGYLAEAQEFVAMLPEGSADDAARTAGRINDRLADRMAVRLRSGVAAYPDGGLTLDDLMDSARRNQDGAVVTLFRMRARE